MTVSAPAAPAVGDPQDVSVSGTSPITSGEPVHVYLEPPPSFLGSVPEGGEYTSVQVATAEVADDGTFQVTIAKQRLVDLLGSEDVATLLVRHGDAFALTSVGLGGNDTIPSQSTVALEGSEIPQPDAPPSMSVTAANDPAGSTDFAQLPGVATASVPPVDYFTELGTFSTSGGAACATHVNTTYPNVPHTVVVAGSNSGLVKTHPIYTFGTSSTLGYATEVDAGWVKSRNHVTLSNGSQVDMDWESKYYSGGNSFRIDAEYQWRTTRCRSTYSNTTYQTDVVAPSRFTGGSYKHAPWTSNLRPTHCVLMNAKTTIRRTRSTTWGNGSKLSWTAAKETLGINFDVSSRAGYNDSTSITFTPTYPDRYLCGAYDVPAGTPGHLMGDFMDR